MTAHTTILHGSVVRPDSASAATVLFACRNIQICNAYDCLDTDPLIHVEHFATPTQNLHTASSFLCASIFDGMHDALTYPSRSMGASDRNGPSLRFHTRQRELRPLAAYRVVQKMLPHVHHPPATHHWRLFIALTFPDSIIRRRRFPGKRVRGWNSNGLPGEALFSAARDESLAAGRPAERVHHALNDATAVCDERASLNARVTSAKRLPVSGQSGLQRSARQSYKLS